MQPKLGELLPCLMLFMSNDVQIVFALQFRGRQCEEEVHVDVPGFVGHSLLVHNVGSEGGGDDEGDGVGVSLADGDGFTMFLSFQTSSPDGVIFYRQERI